ncbi:MAG: hypothetical protein ACTSYL_03070 [Candidatus Thorarchaeota archaeon]
MDRTPSSENSESDLPILKTQVIGGPKDKIVEDFTQYLSPQEDPRVYRTWFNIRLLSRLENLFKDGIESAGGLFEIICVFLVALLIVGFVFLSQFVIFSIVVVVVAIFSGGASLKFFRTTYIEIPETSISIDGLEDFVRTQLDAGSLVSIALSDPSKIGSITRRSNRATKAYLSGINTCQFIAMVFTFVEVLHYILFHRWLVDTLILTIFGLIFLVGIIVLDAGVFLRHRLAKDLSTTTTAATG